MWLLLHVFYLKLVLHNLKLVFELFNSNSKSILGLLNNLVLVGLALLLLLLFFLVVHLLHLLNGELKLAIQLFLKLYVSLKWFIYSFLLFKTVLELVGFVLILLVFSFLMGLLLVHRNNFFFQLIIGLDLTIDLWRHLRDDSLIFVDHWDVALLSLSELFILLDKSLLCFLGPLKSQVELKLTCLKLHLTFNVRNFDERLILHLLLPWVNRMVAHPWLNSALRVVLTKLKTS